MHAFFLQPNGGDADGIGYMQGRADTGVGVDAVEKSDGPGKEIVPGELGRAQVLAVWKEYIDRHGDGLGDDDKDLQPLKTVYIVKQKISQRDDDQKIPKNIGDQKDLAKRDQIIDGTMNDIATFCRDQILGKNEENKVDYPAKQQF